MIKLNILEDVEVIERIKRKVKGRYYIEGAM